MIVADIIINYPETAQGSWWDNIWGPAVGLAGVIAGSVIGYAGTQRSHLVAFNMAGFDTAQKYLVEVVETVDNQQLTLTHARDALNERLPAIQAEMVRTGSRISVNYDSLDERIKVADAAWHSVYSRRQVLADTSLSEAMQRFDRSREALVKELSLPSNPSTVETLLTAFTASQHAVYRALQLQRIRGQITLTRSLVSGYRRWSMMREQTKQYEATYKAHQLAG